MVVQNCLNEWNCVPIPLLRIGVRLCLVVLLGDENGTAFQQHNPPFSPFTSPNVPPQMSHQFVYLVLVGEICKTSKIGSIKYFNLKQSGNLAFGDSQLSGSLQGDPNSVPHPRVNCRLLSFLFVVFQPELFVVAVVFYFSAGWLCLGWIFRGSSSFTPRGIIAFQSSIFYHDKTS